MSSFRTRAKAWILDYGCKAGMIVCAAVFAVCDVVCGSAISKFVLNGVMPVGWGSRTGVLLYFSAIISFVILQFVDIHLSRRLTEVGEKLDKTRRDKDVLSARVTQMEQEIQEVTQAIIYDFEVLIQARLKGIGDDLGFNKQLEKTDRVTIYCYDPSSVFVQFGRHSENPECRKPGEKIKPAEKGCIAEAWRNGFAFIADFPEYDHDKAQYLRRARGYGLSRSDVKALTMKARLYCGWRITSTDGQTDLAVIIIESTLPNRWTREELLAYKERENPLLRQTLERVGPRIPQISKPHMIGL